MSNTTLRCEIITPESPVFQGEVTSVIVPAHDGLRGIKPGHAPFLSRLGVGIATVQLEGGTTQKFAVRDGFLKIDSAKVTLLAVQAIKPDAVPTEAELSAEAEEVAAKMAKSHGEEAHEDLTLDRDWISARKALRSA